MPRTGRRPTCPEWTLYDLGQHIGEGRCAWAVTVAAGPDAAGTASDLVPHFYGRIRSTR